MNNDIKTLISLMLNNARERNEAKTTLMESMQKELDDNIINLNIPFAVIGGHAVNQYGTLRSTSDVDVLVKMSDFKELCENHPEARPLSFHIESLHGITIGNIDIISSTSDWINEAISTVNIIDDIPYINKNWLILMKMLSSNAKDISDIIDMIKKSTKSEIENMKETIKKYNDSNYEDFKSLIIIAKLEKDSI